MVALKLFLWALMDYRAAKVKTPISAINPDQQRRRDGGQVNRDLRGFTLIELLVVLAIGSLLVALVPPAFDRLRDVSQYRDTVRAIVVDLKQARQQALAYGQVVTFRVDLSARQFGIVGRPFRTLPSSLEVKTTVGNNESPDNTQQASIAFMPEGGSSGGTVELVRRSGAGVRIRVDWLFGQITQEPRTQ
jgi:general secretion pathway protein H